MRNLAGVAFSAILVMWSAEGRSQPVTQDEVLRAQAEMQARVLDAANTFAKQIDATEFVPYCQMELHLKTYSHPVDGHIPFGVNYGRISDRAALTRVLASREAYEKPFMWLCLAAAKKAIVDAARR